MCTSLALAVGASTVIEEPPPIVLVSGEAGEEPASMISTATTLTRLA
jgi:hypothetical protein